ncbi:carotenoid isomerooxygenase isoform X2 [Coccinella septempunctata]|uniref:carotenoid isomerooxygenase isoform X1 n=1 Tax=Coccinella septempunctata TaxID=41139 RepID=UPI001D08E88B|nr:carotenoid isomerooxygenase isoform X1 [Coccinella septempunctata]XP_044744863.1 carotenoid isomerooxygenase isoform X2 [Coccinella septempunctata]
MQTKVEIPESAFLATSSVPGDSSPVFTWSPLPPRRQLSFTKKQKLPHRVSEKELYPNCDVNVWLRSCEEEIIEPLEGCVKGTIPPWLQGCLLRNGPGSLKVGHEYFQHLFDSSALIHRFNIADGKVTYQCRFLKSDVYKRNWEAKRIVVTEFGTKAVPDPCHSIFDRVAAIFNPSLAQSDNSMISLYPFGDQIYAFGEIPIIHKINSETLETEKRVDISQYISIVHHTSHPHVLRNGDVYNLAMSMSTKGPVFNIVRFPHSVPEYHEATFEKANIVASIPSRWPFHPSYMHTFGITDNYFIIVEQPLNVAAAAVIANKLTNESLAGCFRWFPEEYTQINVISRKTGTLCRKFYAESFFYLHIINQYEDCGHVVVDICIYRDPSMLDCMYVETMKSMHHNPDYAKMFRGRPARYVLPMHEDENKDSSLNIVKLENTKAKAFYTSKGDILVTPERLCNVGCETPRINYENFLGKSYRFFYAISSDVDAENPGTIIKVDIHNKTTKKWFESNCYPSEPIFIPSPEAKFEDDGVVLSAMVWGGDDENHAGIIILDARTFTEIARAEFHTPSPVPKCLHGWFLPKKDV